jgi:phosphoglycolate phosphatase-like HAD superfamily hydrolase
MALVLLLNLSYNNRNQAQSNAVGNQIDKDGLYLGDSENDNPAFRKAGVSIGVRSDSRIIPKLECQQKT